MSTLKPEEKVRLLGSSASPREETQQAPTPQDDPHPRRQRKFVLCFDGTGNKFSGTDADSNILKIYRLLDRSDAEQFHYYQPGIGTYVTTGSLSHTSHWARLKSWCAKAKDSAVGTSFDQHVMGGYKFLMRYYNPGDEIYFFGFSRGAYTARFLAEMLDRVGLLSAGNEEMARFAWKTFQRWQIRTEGTAAEKAQKQQLLDFMCAFRETFSRPVRRIRFLGLFDTVNSVPRFENAWMERSKFPYTARSTAKVIRHAVAIDERRAKFRQDLISEGKTSKKHHSHHHHHHPYMHRRRSKLETEGRDDVNGNAARNNEADASPERYNSFNRGLGPPRAFRDSSETSGVRSLSPGYSERDDHRRPSGVSSVTGPSLAAIRHAGGYDSDEEEQDIKEVWFAGCHADIGGGWPLEPGEDRGLSHVPLVWMVREAQRAGLRFDERKLHALNCCPDADADADAATQPWGDSMAPSIQISAATPPLEAGPSRGFDPSTTSTTGNSNSNSNQPVPAAPSSSPSPPSFFHASLHQAATRSKMHDVLRFRNGAPALSVISWNAMEWIPFRRMDLLPDGSWKSIAWPLPKGEVRDVPHDALVHHSVLRRMLHDPDYRPGNLICGGGGRGVRKAPPEMGVGRWRVHTEEGDPVGEVLVKA